MKLSILPTTLLVALVAAQAEPRHNHYCSTTTQTIQPPCAYTPPPTTCITPDCIVLKTVTATCPHLPCSPVKTVTTTNSCVSPTCQQGCATTTTTVPAGICPG